MVYRLDSKIAHKLKLYNRYTNIKRKINKTKKNANQKAHVYHCYSYYVITDLTSDGKSSNRRTIYTTKQNINTNEATFKQKTILYHLI